MSEPLTAKDFTTDQEVRWCPGCGDYAILKAARSALAKIGRPPHEVVFISGIGCAARFPYYVESYGFHTIHGRAPAVAAGVRLANPDLDIWVVGGDGDFLAIGGNHLLHTLRRDTNLNLLLFNNAIYGLTKGQYSPTSPVGTRSPTSPEGTTETPADAAQLALGAGARFVARTADVMVDHLTEMLLAAQAQKGAALVEIFQNCPVYFDGAWGGLAAKATRAEESLILAHGAPLVYGGERDKGLIWRAEAGGFDIVEDAPDAVAERATVFDETNHAMATALARMDRERFPVALGVLYRAPPAETAPASKRRLDAAALQQIVAGADTWRVAQKD